jgi:hypothetical protein
MGHSPPSEADSRSGGQDIPHLFWNTKVYYRVHKSPPLIPLLSQMNPVHNLTLSFFNIHFNIILPALVDMVMNLPVS